jgi:hypothetical protein
VCRQSRCQVASCDHHTDNMLRVQRHENMPSRATRTRRQASNLNMVGVSGRGNHVCSSKSKIIATCKRHMNKCTFNALV